MYFGRRLHVSYNLGLRVLLQLISRSEFVAHVQIVNLAHQDIVLHRLPHFILNVVLPSHNSNYSQ